MDHAAFVPLEVGDGSCSWFGSLEVAEASPVIVGQSASGCVAVGQTCPAQTTWTSWAWIQVGRVERAIGANSSINNKERRRETGSGSLLTPVYFFFLVSFFAALPPLFTFLRHSEISLRMSGKSPSRSRARMRSRNALRCSPISSSTSPRL